MKDQHGFLHGMQSITFHDLLDFASSPPQRGASTTNPGDHDTLKISELLVQKGPHEQDGTVLAFG